MNALLQDNWFLLPMLALMAGLAALAPLGARLRDVNIHEPSLEDVYFDLREG